MSYASRAAACAPNSEGPVLRLTLDRADQRNAVNDAMLDAMIGHLAAAGTDEAVRAIRIDAEGPDFCAGADLDRQQRPAPNASRGSAASSAGCRTRPTG